MKKLGIAGLLLLLVASASSTALALPTLYDWAFNINGAMFAAPATFSGPDPGQLPGYVDDSGLDWSAGLGTDLPGQQSCNTLIYKAKGTILLAIGSH
jgi:hypothetical protein